MLNQAQGLQQVQTITKTKVVPANVAVVLMGVVTTATLLGLFSSLFSYSAAVSLTGGKGKGGGKPVTNSLQVYLAPLPVAQQVIAGTQDQEFARVVIDATALTDDVEVKGINLTTSVADGAQLTDVNNLILIEDSAEMSALIDPAQILSFQLFSPFIIQAGTSRTLKVIGDVDTSATDGIYQIGIQKFSKSLKLDPVEVNYVGTNKKLSVDYQYNAGPAMSFTIQGTLSINKAPSAANQLVPANAAVELNRVKLTSTREDMVIRGVSLCIQDGGNNNGSEAGDSNDIAEFIVSSSLNQATSLFSGVIGSGEQCRTFNLVPGSLVIPKDSSAGVTLIIKATTADIGVGLPGIAGADFKVGLGGPNGVDAIGVSSGARPEKNYVSSTSSVAKLQLAYPGVSLNTLPQISGLFPGSVISDFSIVNTTAKPLAIYRLSFTTIAGGDPDLDVTGAYLIEQSTGKSLSAASSGVKDSSGHRNFSFVLADPDNPAESGRAYRIGSGESVRVQMLASNVSGVDATADGFLSTKLVADQPVNVSEADIGVVNIAGFYSPTSNGNFVWSDLWLNDAYNALINNATTSPQWWNGYLVPGLPSAAATAQIIFE